MAAKKRPTRRTTKQTSDRISSLAATGMANWRHLSPAERRKWGAGQCMPFGLTRKEIASILASCESQDETKGKRS